MVFILGQSTSLLLFLDFLSVNLKSGMLVSIIDLGTVDMHHASVVEHPSHRVVHVGT